MTVIEEFPDDDAYRVIKWVDKFQLPHLKTRSTSVTVRLQRLPFRNHSELNRLTREEAVALLPLDRNDPLQGQYLSLPLHAGLLPHLVVGRVYQGRRLVGELHTTSSTIFLPDAEQSCTEIKLGQELERPTDWDRPYKLIFSAEFGGVQSEFSNSRCLVFVNERGIEFIIPRTVIFQRFYAIHPELARAFTGGPWESTKSRIVHEKPLDSGQKTQIEPVSGDWHIVLKRLVPDDYGFLVALLYFDEYAKACAESIYAGMLSDRRGNTFAPWFASARLPFRVEAEPLSLAVKGFMLLPRLGRYGSDGKRTVHKQTFLVTSILGGSWPSYVPDIWVGRGNSGEQGLEQLQVEGTAPYAGVPRRRPAGSDLVTTSDVDASATEANAFTLEDSFSWLGGPELKKLTKERSQRYDDRVVIPPQLPPPKKASGGERTYEDGNAAPAEPKVLVRDPVNRFLYLLKAFDELQRLRNLSRYSVFQPIISSQMTPCGGLICWNFLDEDARTTGRWPHAGWRMIERARRIGLESSSGTPRCVLVVRVEFDNRVGYWFEIESREGALSPFIVDLEMGEQEAAQHVVESVARARGRNLRRVMASVIDEIGSGSAHCYKHIYKGGHNSELDPNSLLRFLAKFKPNNNP